MSDQHVRAGEIFKMPQFKPLHPSAEDSEIPRSQEMADLTVRCHLPCSHTPRCSHTLITGGTLHLNSMSEEPEARGGGLRSATRCHGVCGGSRGQWQGWSSRGEICWAPFVTISLSSCSATNRGNGPYIPRGTNLAIGVPLSNRSIGTLAPCHTHTHTHTEFQLAVQSIDCKSSLFHP